MKEYARAYMTVRLERMGTESDSLQPEDKILDIESVIECIGHAMNGFELRESMPSFLAAGAMQVLQEACGYSEELARGLLVREFDHRV